MVAHLMHSRRRACLKSNVPHTSGGGRFRGGCLLRRPGLPLGNKDV